MFNALNQKDFLILLQIHVKNVQVIFLFSIKRHLFVKIVQKIQHFIIKQVIHAKNAHKELLYFKIIHALDVLKICHTIIFLKKPVINVL